MSPDPLAPNRRKRLAGRPATVAFAWGVLLLVSITSSLPASDILRDTIPAEVLAELQLDSALSEVEEALRNPPPPEYVLEVKGEAEDEARTRTLPIHRVMDVPAREYRSLVRETQGDDAAFLQRLEVALCRRIARGRPFHLHASYASVRVAELAPLEARASALLRRAARRRSEGHAATIAAIGALRDTGDVGALLDAIERTKPAGARARVDRDWEIAAMAYLVDDPARSERAVDRILAADLRDPEALDLKASIFFSTFRREAAGPFWRLCLASVRTEREVAVVLQKLGVQACCRGRREEGKKRLVAAVMLFERLGGDEEIVRSYAALSRWDSDVAPREAVGSACERLRRGDAAGPPEEIAVLLSELPNWFLDQRDGAAPAFANPSVARQEEKTLPLIERLEALGCLETLAWALERSAADLGFKGAVARLERAIRIREELEDSEGIASAYRQIAELLAGGSRMSEFSDNALVPIAERFKFSTRDIANLERAAESAIRSVAWYEAAGSIRAALESRIFLIELRERQARLAAILGVEPDRYHAEATVLHEEGMAMLEAHGRTHEMRELARMQVRLAHDAWKRRDPDSEQRHRSFAEAAYERVGDEAEASSVEARIHAIEYPTSCGTLLRYEIEREYIGLTILRMVSPAPDSFAVETTTAIHDYWNDRRQSRGSRGASPTSGPRSRRLESPSQ